MIPASAAGIARGSADRPRRSSRRKYQSSVCCTTSSSPRSTRASTATSPTSCASTTTRRVATTKRAGTTSTSSDGWVTRCRSRSTSSVATRYSPRHSYSTSRLFFDLAARAGEKGVQEWLSFYFKSPQTADPATARARHLHPADQAQEHVAGVDGRSPGYPQRSGLTRGVDVQLTMRSSSVFSEGALVASTMKYAARSSRPRRVRPLVDEVERAE